MNGSVYFRVSKHRKYGTLACLDKAGMEVRLRFVFGRSRQIRSSISLESTHVVCS